MKKIGRLNGVAVSAMALFMVSGQAQAQEAGQDTSATTAGGQLDTVLVTARGREERLQDTPVSITAFSGRALAERQVATVTDLGKFTPNVSFEAGANIAGSSSAVTMFIRGIGQTDFTLTSDPGVALYVDGVYVGRSVGALVDTMDLSRAEVLRGPQGTLFGKNTIGGAVTLTSKSPSDKLEAYVDATTGRFNRFDLRGGINLPLSDTLAVRVNGALQTRDGYVERLSDGGRMGNRNSASGRMAVRWMPTPALEFTLAVDGTRTREEAAPVVLLQANELGGFASFYNFALNGATCFTPPNGVPTPRVPQCFNSQWVTGDPYKTWAAGPNYSNLDLWGASLTTNWNLGPVALKSISAYRSLKSRFVLDTDGSPLPIAETQDDYNQHQFSQELQMSGDGLADRLKWVVGLYYLNEKGTNRNNLTFAIADFRSGGSVNNDSYAAFAQATYQLAKRLNLTVGGRYTNETKRFLPDQFIKLDRTGGALLALSQMFIPSGNPNGNLILPAVERSAKAREFTPAVTLDYKLTPETLVYVSYSRGFKSGGFTQRVFPPEPVAPAFDPEYANSYEAGAKLALLDRRLRVNGAVFRTDYSDLQLVVNEGIAPKVRNAGRARIQGFELEGEASVCSALRLSGGVGFTDAKLRYVSPAAAPVTVGSQLPDTPRWTATAGGTLILWKAEGASLSNRWDWSYKGGHFKDAINSPGLYQAGYSLVNASLTYDTEHWSITAGVTNLTDKAYLTSGYQDLANAGATTGAYSRPREWFLKVGARL